MSSREKYINNQLEHLIQEYRSAQAKLSEVNTKPTAVAKYCSSHLQLTSLTETSTSTCKARVREDDTVSAQLQSQYPLCQKDMKNVKKNWKKMYFYLFSLTVFTLWLLTIWPDWSWIFLFTFLYIFFWKSCRLWKIVCWYRQYCRLKHEIKFYRDLITNFFSLPGQGAIPAGQWGGDWKDQSLGRGQWTHRPAFKISHVHVNKDLPNFGVVQAISI